MGGLQKSLRLLVIDIRQVFVIGDSGLDLVHNNSKLNKISCFCGQRAAIKPIPDKGGRFSVNNHPGYR